MKTVIAPDSFKGSCTSMEATDVIKQGLLQRTALKDTTTHQHQLGNTERSDCIMCEDKN